mmetsp:Transcript_32922/g.61234  ORF Transcript_32922/g.61234 Transcript_32922/m.61234 type:complete len:218 (+) Transcript_32922:416-1069(+)
MPSPLETVVLRLQILRHVKHLLLRDERVIVRGKLHDELAVFLDLVPLPWPIVVPCLPFVLDPEVCVARRNKDQTLQLPRLRIPHASLCSAAVAHQDGVGIRLQLLFDERQPDGLARAVGVRHVLESDIVALVLQRLLHRGIPIAVVDRVAAVAGDNHDAWAPPVLLLRSFLFFLRHLPPRATATCIGFGVVVVVVRGLALFFRLLGLFGLHGQWTEC